MVSNRKQSFLLYSSVVYRTRARTSLIIRYEERNKDVFSQGQSTDLALIDRVAKTVIGVTIVVIAIIT